MCAVSAVTDHYIKKFEPYQIPSTIPWPTPAPMPVTPTVPPYSQIPAPLPITRDEFDQLRKDILEMKEILKVLKEYDKTSNQPHCEKQENVAFLKKLAAQLDIELPELD